MTLFSIVHFVVILLVLGHMFTLGTIESENKYCYFTWPLMHLYYCFLNYLFSWFYCYNYYQITKKEAQNSLLLSIKFLKAVTFLSLFLFPLKMLANN